MKRVARSTIVEKIKNSGGRFFSVLFQKRTNGALRLMTCKINTDNLDENLKKNLIPVIDTNIKDYRSVNINGIIMACVDGETYRVKG